jgi:hypothetical protein
MLPVQHGAQENHWIRNDYSMFLRRPWHHDNPSPNELTALPLSRITFDECGFAHAHSGLMVSSSVPRSSLGFENAPSPASSLASRQEGGLVHALVEILDGKFTIYGNTAGRR